MIRQICDEHMFESLFIYLRNSFSVMSSSVVRANKRS